MRLLGGWLMESEKERRRMELLEGVKRA